MCGYGNGYDFAEYRISAVNGHLLTVQCATVNAAAGGNVQKPLVGDGGYDKTYTVYMLSLIHISLRNR